MLHGVTKCNFEMKIKVIISHANCSSCRFKSWPIGPKVKKLQCKSSMPLIHLPHNVLHNYVLKRT